MWDYAELSKFAKRVGGPEKLPGVFINYGKKQMYPVVGAALALGSVLTLGIHKIYRYYNENKASSNAELEIAEQILVQGIKDYDLQQEEKEHCRADAPNNADNLEKEDKSSGQTVS